MHFVPPDVSATPLRVLFADAALAVVVKPRELLSCPGTSTPNWDSVQTRIPRLFPDAHGPILAHRLDAPTSGLMVVALDPETHRRLSRAFAEHRVAKRYEALLDGTLASAPALSAPAPDGLESGMTRLITLPMRSDWRQRPRQVVDFARGRPAQTRWRVLGVERHGDVVQTRVAFEPLTGRTHQLRLHAADPRGLDCPIVGDRIYGRTAAPDGHAEPLAPLLLHACRLAFVHPTTGESLAFESPPDF